jgi:V/A-type H+/Na+-transporting ATPase subunit E
MKKLDESFRELSQTVLSEAQAEADQILADARQKAEAIRQQAQEEAEAERKRILDAANQESSRIRSQAVSNAQMKARTMQLEGREELLNGVFAKAQGMLATMQKWPDYAQISQNLLEEALAHLRVKEAVVRADATTQAHLTDTVLANVTEKTGTQLRMGKPITQGMGVIVETTDGHRQFDNTLETRLARSQNALRSPVYHILMGEAQ